VAAALSVYHLAPLVRAGSRIVEGSEDHGKGLGGPIVHLTVHMVCFGALLGVFMSKSNANEIAKMGRRR
jgi:hypothetical protein